MKKIIAVSCILFMCCFWAKADVKDVEKFSKEVDALSSFVGAFIEYTPRIDKIFGKVKNFKINTETKRKDIEYADWLNDLRTEEDFKKLYNFLEELEQEGNLTFTEAIKLKGVQTNFDSTAKRLISDLKYLISFSGRLKKEYPNYSKRKAASNKLKAVLEKFLKAGGVKLSPNEKRNLMKSF